MKTVVEISVVVVLNKGIERSKKLGLFKIEGKTQNLARDISRPQDEVFSSCSSPAAILSNMRKLEKCFLSPPLSSSGLKTSSIVKCLIASVYSSESLP